MPYRMDCSGAFRAGTPDGYHWHSWHASATGMRSTATSRASVESETMPTYQYRCQGCHHELEAFQKFTDDPLTTCTECGGMLRKVYNPVGIVFKGSGFYATDSRKSSSASAAARDSKATGSGGETPAAKDTGTAQESPASTGTATATTSTSTTAAA